MTQLAFDFSMPRPLRADRDAQDYHRLPASEKQLAFARQLAARHKLTLPDAVLSDRKALSQWIDANKGHAAEGRFSNYPSSKQVAYAERIARMKRRAVPDACFKDKSLMSHWIDSNR